jgi:hypothetical protein
MQKTMFLVTHIGLMDHGVLFVVAITCFSALAAPITTLIQWNIGLALLTIGEIILGAFIVSFMPLHLRLILNVISPIIAIVIMGALWGFWYI